MNDSPTLSTTISLAEINQLYKLSDETGRAGPNDKRLGLKRNNQLVCAARLLNYGHDQWLLRNLCSHPEYRNQGLASQLLSALHAQMEWRGHIYTLPLPHLNDFYRANGYKLIGDQQVPEAILPVLRQSRRRHKGIRVMVATLPVR